MTMAEKIIRIRKGNNLTQEQFAEIIDISSQTVYNWESGAAAPSNENLKLISEKFGVGLSVFYEEDLPDYESLYSHKDCEPVAQTGENNTKKRIVFATLIMAVLFNCFYIKTETKISKLENTVKELSARIDVLKNQNYSIQNTLNMVNNKPQTDRYTYFDYQVVEYNRHTNMLKIKIRVTPADFSKATTVQFTTDTSVGNFITDAEYSDHIYTGIIETYRQENMPLYMYLTDNGRVRTFLIDYLPDLTKEYKLDFGYMGIAGGEDILLENGLLSIKAVRADVSVIYTVDKDNKNKSVYPEKAEFEIYADDVLLLNIPFENLVDVDYYSAAEKSGYYNNRENRYKYSTYLNLDKEIKNEKISGGAELKFILKVEDNHGFIYEKTVTNGY